MIDTKFITEQIISSRNILLNGISNDHVMNGLQQVESNLNKITNETTKNILKFCVPIAIDQVQNSNYAEAGWILNFAHNFPIQEEKQKNWDVDYFLSVELPAFLDHYEEIKSARKIVLYVCSQIADRYASNL